MPDLSSNPSRPRGSYACKVCRSRIANKKEVLSWAFRGFSGKAVLLNRVSAVTFDKPTILLMNTGAHTVQDFACKVCSTVLGWRIVKAHEWPEKWKEGNCILELNAVLEDSQEIDDFKASSRSSSRTPSPLASTPTTPTPPTRKELASMEPLVPPPIRTKSLQVPQGIGMGHKRSTSDTSLSDRQRPIGPRVQSLRNGERI